MSQTNAILIAALKRAIKSAIKSAIKPLQDELTRLEHLESLAARPTETEERKVKWKAYPRELAFNRFIYDAADAFGIQYLKKFTSTPKTGGTRKVKLWAIRVDCYDKVEEFVDYMNSFGEEIQTTIVDTDYFPMYKSIVVHYCR